MYGTIARIRPKPGSEAALVSLMEEWERTRLPKIKGAVASYVLKSEKDPGELIMVAVFEDRQTYRANAEDPEQDKWYRKLREQLQADPVWEDGNYVFGKTYKAVSRV